MNWKAEAKEKLRKYDAMRLATINIPRRSNVWKLMPGVSAPPELTPPP